MTRFLLVPGRGMPTPEHWMCRWIRDNPTYRWAPEPIGRPYRGDERVAALQAALAESDEPAVLIAHSAGCLTVALWASRHRGPVQAALLVTPPHLDPEWTPGPDDPDDLFVGFVPHEPLPFPSVLVASRTDPWATFEQTAALAADWGAELVDAGAAGHLGTADGYGPWPDGERLVATLAARTAQAPRFTAPTRAPR